MLLKRRTDTQDMMQQFYVFHLESQNHVGSHLNIKATYRLKINQSFFLVYGNLPMKSFIVSTLIDWFDYNFTLFQL